MMGGERRNVLQSMRISLVCGLQRKFHAAALAFVRLMHTPWLVPAPHSLCHYAIWSVWQLHTEHHSYSSCTPRLQACTGVHLLKHPGLNRGWPKACDSFIKRPKLPRNGLRDEQLEGGRDWGKEDGTVLLIPASGRPSPGKLIRLSSLLSNLEILRSKRGACEKQLCNDNLSSRPFPFTTSLAESQQVPWVGGTTLFTHPKEKLLSFIEHNLKLFTLPWSNSKRASTEKYRIERKHS